MDSIEKINQYNLSHKVINSPILVKKISTPEGKYQFLVYPLTKQQVKEIIATKDLDLTIISDIKSQKFINEKEDIKSIIFCGNLTKFTSYEDLVYQFPLRRIDIRNRVDPEYRLYTRTLEEQKQHKGIFNICRTPDKSWKSVIEKIGNNYGIIIKIKI